jgi:hypothetical protein
MAAIHSSIKFYVITMTTADDDNALIKVGTVTPPASAKDFKEANGTAKTVTRPKCCNQRLQGGSVPSAKRKITQHLQTSAHWIPFAPVAAGM